jgi:hypothetical protein
MNKKFYFASILVLLCFFFASCSVLNLNKSEDFISNSYKVLKTSKSTYDLTTDSLIQLRTNGQINDDSWTMLNKYGDIYADAHNAAVNALYAYKLLSTESAKGEVEMQIKAVTSAIAVFVRAAAPYVKLLDK